MSAYHINNAGTLFCNYNYDIKYQGRKFMKILKYLILILLILQISLFSSPKPLIQNNEILIFNVKPEKGDPYISKTIYKSEKKNGSLNYSYIHYDKNVKFDVRTDGLALPDKIIYKNGDTEATFSFAGSGSVNMTFINGRESVTETEKFIPNVTVENALVARTLDLNNTEKHEFDLLQCDKLPDLVAYRMFFQVIGEETVTVKAGTFNCKKVLFSLTGWKGMFYKAYYYISNDEHRYLVKMDNMPKGGSTELIEIQ